MQAIIFTSSQTTEWPGVTAQPHGQHRLEEAVCWRVYPGHQEVSSSMKCSQWDWPEESGFEIELSFTIQTMNNSVALIHSRPKELLWNSIMGFAGQEPLYHPIRQLMPHGACVCEPAQNSTSGAHCWSVLEWQALVRFGTLFRKFNTDWN